MKFRIFLLVLIALIVGALFFNFYSFIFAKKFKGEVVGIERVTQPTAILGSRIDPSNVYSFAIAIRDKEKGEIYTASSEDRQWAVVQKGQCAEAKFFPYPPWDIEKADTYYNARLLRLYDCESGK